MKAIETRYAGCRFRSRLEARWAVFFDHLELRWEYEPQGYETSVGRYLPDFWLPDIAKWVEIKGARPSPGEIDRCTAFAREQWAQEKKFMVLQGDIPRAPEFHPELGPLGIPCVAWTSAPREGDWPTWTGLSRPGEQHELSGFIPAHWLPPIETWAAIAPGLTKARSARFEHGERG